METNEPKKACTHPTLKKEYYLGSQTGDKECTACGKTFSPDELKDMGR
ncbi:hypothetical protein [Streptomyces sp. NPDC056323]